MENGTEVTSTPPPTTFLFLKICEIVNESAEDRRAVNNRDSSQVTPLLTPFVYGLGVNIITSGPEFILLSKYPDIFNHQAG